MMMMRVVVVVVLMIMIMIVMVVITVRTAGMVRMIMIQEVRIAFERALQVERAAVKHTGKVNAGALGTMNDGMRVDGTNRCFDCRKFIGGDKVGLV